MESFQIFMWTSFLLLLNLCAISWAYSAAIQPRNLHRRRMGGEVDRRFKAEQALTRHMFSSLFGIQCIVEISLLARSASQIYLRLNNVYEAETDSTLRDATNGAWSNNMIVLTRTWPKILARAARVLFCWRYKGD